MWAVNQQRLVLHTSQSISFLINIQSGGPLNVLYGPNHLCKIFFCLSLHNWFRCTVVPKRSYSFSSYEASKPREDCFSPSQPRFTSIFWAVLASSLVREDYVCSQHLNPAYLDVSDGIVRQTLSGNYVEQLPFVCGHSALSFDTLKSAAWLPRVHSVPRPSHPGPRE